MVMEHNDKEDDRVVRENEDKVSKEYLERSIWV